MITDLTTIKAMNPGNNTAIQEAAYLYLKWKSTIPFNEDLAHYLVFGCVATRPTAFAMAKVIQLPESDKEWSLQPAWFIRIAVGQMMELISLLPRYLPWIAFCRRGEDRMRVYKLERLLRLAEEQEERRRKHIEEVTTWAEEHREQVAALAQA